MKKQEWIVVSLVSVCASCAAHVTVPSALPRSAPFDQRLGMYLALRPVESTSVITYSRNGVSRSFSHVTIADGRDVYYPLDLVPLVGEESATARGGRRANTLNAVSGWMALGSLGAMGAGGALFAEGISNSGDTGLALTGVVVAVSGLASLFATIVVSRSSNGAREEAFRAYDPELAERLGICTTVYGPADCQAVAPPQPLLAPAAPAGTMLPPMVVPQAPAPSPPATP